MQAAFLTQHGGPEVLRFGEVPTPEVRPSTVRVRVRAAAINHLDIWVRKGLPGLKLSYPHVLGGDAAGIVDKIGDGITNFSVGQDVIVHPGLACGQCEACRSGWESLCSSYQILGEHVSGTHAEFVVVPAENLFSKPSNLSFEEAASLPLVFTTAWQMVVRRAQVQKGEWVLVHAAGSGVGSAAIQIARLHGAHVIATAGSDDKLELARRLGAEETVNYRSSDWLAAVKKIRKGGCEVIIDHLGSDYWEANLKALKWGGRIAVCGATSGWVAQTDLRQVFYRQLQILGSTMGSKTDFGKALEAIAAGKMRAVVDKAFPLKDVRQAHEYLESRGQFGKVVLLPGSA